MITTTGDAGQLAALLDPGVVVRWPPSSPMRDWHGPKEVADGFASHRAPTEIGLDPDTFSTVVYRLLVDANTAALEVTVTADTLNGARQLPVFWAPALAEIPTTPSYRGPDTNQGGV